MLPTIRMALVVDLDGVDDRMDVALLGVDVRGMELFVHQPRERIDLPISMAAAVPHWRGQAPELF